MSERDIVVEELRLACSQAPGVDMTAVSPSTVLERLRQPYLSWQCDACSHDNVNEGLVCGLCGKPGPNLNSSVTGETPQNRPENDYSSRVRRVTFLVGHLMAARGVAGALARALADAQGVGTLVYGWVVERNTEIARLQGELREVRERAEHWKRFAETAAALIRKLDVPALTPCLARDKDQVWFCTKFKGHVGEHVAEKAPGIEACRWR